MTKINKKTFVLFFLLLLTANSIAQDTLLIEQKLYKVGFRSGGTKIEKFDSIYCLFSKDTVLLEKLNDSTFIFVYDKDYLNKFECIPFVFSNNKGYYPVHIYTSWILDSFVLYFKLYSFRSFRFTSFFKKKYGYVVSKGWIGYSNLVKNKKKLEYELPPERQLKDCLCIP